MPIFHIEDADIYYETHGEGDPFIFCTATSTWGEVWKFYQVPEFARDHQVIIFDQRGTGRSKTNSKDFSIKRLSADAAALLDHLDAKNAIVLGHSNGGRVAQLLALDYPEKVGKLILASSSGTQPLRVSGVSISMCVDLVEKGYENFIRDSALNTGFTAAFRASHPEEVERFMKVRVKEDLPPLAVYLGHVVGRQEFNSGNRLTTLKIPTLIMVGDDEDHGAQGGTTHVAYAHILAEQIPNAKLVILEGQGHYYYFSAGEQTNKIIREFLQ